MLKDELLNPVIFYSQVSGIGFYKLKRNSENHLQAKKIKNYEIYGIFMLIFNISFQILLASVLVKGGIYVELISGSYTYAFDLAVTICSNAIIHIEILRHRWEICNIINDVFNIYYSLGNIQKDFKPLKHLYLFNYFIVLSSISLCILVSTLDIVFSPYDEKTSLRDAIYFTLCETVPGAYCCHFSALLFFVAYLYSVLNDFLKESNYCLKKKDGSLKLIKKIYELEEKLNDAKININKVFSIANHANIALSFAEILDIIYLEAMSEISLELSFNFFAMFSLYGLKLFLILRSSSYASQKVRGF